MRLFHRKPGTLLVAASTAIFIALIALAFATQGKSPLLGDSAAFASEASSGVDQLNGISPLEAIHAEAASSLPGWEPAKLINGNLWDAYGSLPTAPDAEIWLDLELEESQQVFGAQLISRGDFKHFPVSFKFQSSADGETWTDIAGAKYCSYPTPTGLSHGFPFDNAVEAKFIRLISYENTDNGETNIMLHLAEMRLLDETETAKLDHNPEAVAARSTCSGAGWDELFNRAPANRYNIDLSAEWERPGIDILYGFDNLYNSNIVYDPSSEYPFKMWLFGWSRMVHHGDKIYHARSKQLESGWEVYAGNGNWDTTMNPDLWVPVLPGGNSWYDDAAAGDPAVVLKDGVFYMAYSSVGFEPATVPGSTERYINVVDNVMGATSTDGIHWTKAASPILIWEEERAGKGRKVNYPLPYNLDDYYGGYHRPSLIYEDGKWKAWFDYYRPGAYGSPMGYAENSGNFLDPDDWEIVQVDGNMALENWTNPNVVSSGGQYYSFADPPFREKYTRYVTMATSTDGLDWQVEGYMRDPDGLKAQVPEAYVHLDEDGDTWLYVFYSSGSNDIQEYTSIRFMKKKIAEAEEEPELAPVLGGFTWQAGSSPGTTRTTSVPAIPSGHKLKYIVASAGAFAQPQLGAEASDYPHELVVNSNLSVAAGQHLYIVETDGADRIVKWTDILVLANQIASQPPVQGNNGNPATETEDTEDTDITDHNQETEGTTTVDASGIAVTFQGMEHSNAFTAEVTTGVTAGERKTTTITMNAEQLNALLDNSGEIGEANVITIALNNHSDKAITLLSASLFKALAAKNIVLDIRTEIAQFTLPLHDIDLDDAVQQLARGAAVQQFTRGANLDNIQIRIEITNVPDNMLALSPDAANQPEVLAPVVDFTIYVSHEGKTTVVDHFNAYVERKLALPASVNPDRRMTGAVINAEGIFEHVPTRIVRIDDNYYASIQSVTNSMYTVIHNPVSFSNLEAHWAHNSIEDLASRLVLNDFDSRSFNPGAAITRAEFTGIVARALGLHVPGGEQPFQDVSAEDPFYGTISSSSSYGLIQGYHGGWFRPDRSITRQEAMLVIAKAARLASLDISQSEAQQHEALQRFGDHESLSEWAAPAAAFNVQAGIITGNQHSLLQPLRSLTRAEAVVIVQRLLQAAGLIDA